MIFRVAFAACFGALITGCAKLPESIAPLAVSPQAYSNLSCDKLYSQWDTLDKRYSEAARGQRNARHADNFGVFLVGVPMGSLAGADRETDIAYAKGQIGAIQSVMTSKGCRYD